MMSMCLRVGRLPLKVRLRRVPLAVVVVALYLSCCIVDGQSTWGGDYTFVNNNEDRPQRLNTYPPPNNNNNNNNNRWGPRPWNNNNNQGASTNVGGGTRWGGESTWDSPPRQQQNNNVADPQTEDRLDLNLLTDTADALFNPVGVLIDRPIDMAVNQVCQNFFTMIGLGATPFSCSCGADLGDLDASVKCSYSTCLVGTNFFCGGGSFETKLDLEGEGLVTSLEPCVTLDAGLPVGSFDNIELCYTALLAGGTDFNDCEASIKIASGFLSNGSCSCSVCPNGFSVSIDCSEVDIGLGPLSVPGPSLDFCALANFGQAPNYYPAMSTSTMGKSKGKSEGGGRRNRRARGKGPRR